MIISIALGLILGLVLIVLLPFALDAVAFLGILVYGLFVKIPLMCLRAMFCSPRLVAHIPEPVPAPRITAEAAIEMLSSRP